MSERILSTLVELDVDRCQLTYGIAPCTAGRVESGTAQTGAARTITLRAGASAVDGAFVQMTVRIVSGTGAGQERRIGGYVGATKVATLAAAAADFSPAPNATSVYDVINRPGACYNTRQTCQDKLHYVLGTATLTFTGRGSPIPPGVVARPLINDLSAAPTEIDLEEGLARRALTSVQLTDAPSSDVGIDPYLSDRASAPGSTFWRRFMARNLHYAGRAARVKRAFVSAGVWGTWITERYIIDGIEGPEGNGAVTVKLKDPVKLADLVKIPTATSGKLAVDLGVNDLSLTLAAGGGTQYAASGYVRIGSEILRYSANVSDVLSWPNGTYRAQFNTEAAAAKINDLVQQCSVWTDVPYSTVIKDLLNYAGILDADIDVAGIASEDATWLGEQYRVSCCLSDPQDVSARLKELLQQANAVMWWSLLEQKIKFQVVAPRSPNTVATTTLTDAANLILNSVALQRNEAERITMCAIYFGLLTPVANASQAKDFALGEIAIDTDAESANEYGARRVKSIYSRWFHAPNIQAMRTLVRRYVARYRDAPEDVEFSLDPKDASIAEGNVVDIVTARLVNAAGQPKTARLLITRREDRGTHLIYGARNTVFNQRYGFIAPAATPNYPANNGYACISDAAGLMSDGSPGFLII